MTRTTRRILYSAAFLIFFVCAPPVVLLTAGWEWQGWGHGFTHSGVIVVQSEPRAVLTLNDRSVGSTPKRVPGLTPGAYRLALARPGYQPWTQTINLEAGRAIVIGPVRLARTTPTITAGPSQPTPGYWLTDPADRTLVWVHPDGPTSGSATVSLVEPQTEKNSWTIPFHPTDLWQSPRGEVLVFRDPTQQSVVRTSQSDIWLTPRADQLDWSDISENIFVGRQDTSIMLFDALNQTATTVASANSAVFAFDHIWITTRLGEATTLQGRAYAGQAAWITAWSEAGDWELLPSDVNGLLLRNRSTHETRLWTALPQIHQPGLSIGATDQINWTDRNEPPIWKAGVSILTLDTSQHPDLLERTPETLPWLGWEVPRHILVTRSEQSVSIRSVSSRQGRGEIADYQIPPDATLVMQPTKEQILIGYPDGHSETWTWQ